MAETTTTKQAAVWKPPRLMVLAVRSTRNDGGRGSPTVDTWETSCSAAPAPNYRMPTSGEVGREPAAC